MNKNKEKGYLTLFGNIEIRQSDLSFRVPGRLKKLYVEEGDFVKEGTILAELESDIYQNALNQAKASLKQKRAEKLKKISIFKYNNPLCKDNTISKEQCSNIKEDMNSSIASHDYAKASLEKSIIDLDDTKLYAPFDGIILSRVREKGSIIILEGFMDVIALYKAGIENTVAIMGTALTLAHMTMLKRITKNVVLCLDGDQAGQNAMIKCVDALYDQGFHVSIVVIPQGMDPDEFLNAKGQDELVALFDRPVSLIEFKMNYYYQRINTDNYEDRKQYLNSMVEMINGLHDEVDKAYYSELLEKRSGFSKELIQRLLHQSKPVVPVKPAYSAMTYKKSHRLIDKYQKAERELLYFMMQDKKYAMLYEAKAGYMFDHIHRIIASYIVDYYRQYVVLEVADLISQIQDEKIVKTILDIASLNLPELEDNQAIYDYIDTIKEKMKKERVKQLEEDLVNTFDDIQKSKIAMEIIELKKEIDALREKE